MRNVTFLHDLGARSTLSDLNHWTDPSSTKIPDYLSQRCPLGLRPGRRLKTKIRLGCHGLFASSAKFESDASKRKSVSVCKCCNLGVAETVQHTLFDCPAYNVLRGEFFLRMDSVHCGFSSLSPRDRLSLLFSDDTAPNVSSRLYRFLINVFHVRQCRLAKADRARRKPTGSG